MWVHFLLDVKDNGYWESLGSFFKFMSLLFSLSFFLFFFFFSGFLTAGLIFSSIAVLDFY